VVEADAAGNPLPPVSAACACSDATKARLNAAPASLPEAEDPLKPFDLPRFPSSLAMSVPIWESTVQSLVTLFTAND
jgi:hypothetical protein